MQIKYLSLIESLFCDVNPMPIKHALNLIGFNAGPCRLPLTEISEEHLKQLSQKLKQHHLIEADVV